MLGEEVEGRIVKGIGPSVGIFEAKLEGIAETGAGSRTLGLTQVQQMHPPGGLQISPVTSCSPCMQSLPPPMTLKHQLGSESSQSTTFSTLHVSKQDPNPQDLVQAPSSVESELLQKYSGEVGTRLGTPVGLLGTIEGTPEGELGNSLGSPVGLQD
jgi:hypothetical protein